MVLTMQYVLSNREFDLFRTLIYKTSGISLNLSKKELVKARLSKRLTKTGIDSFGEYYRFVTRDDKNGDELVNLIDSISTNKTDFFREKKHFDFLNAKLLPDLISKKEKDRNKKLRIWCAASSTGEEPYTLAMTVLNHINTDSLWDAKILATDISTKVLQKAIRGIYKKDTLKDISPAILSTYFSSVVIDNVKHYKVKDHLKKLITFRRFNLTTANFPFKNPFDFIFCRNVMIYFDSDTQQRLVSKFYDCLPKGGYLFVGHSETLSKNIHGFKYIKPAVYQK
ncbi:MAG: chemotaxis protein methyltransferase [Candidatus Scalindua rubra]|uniref:protein-glutamate O-methyltransferase n=1 Tax=Candidatus Scalindua rubra TaxID=1872076 RepID=A0A1E3XF09_9BACT|nr:MAG: chemotaxis protein methyltransferase [Candidatus Scalindua rubra]